jgi:ferredoxin
MDLVESIRKRGFEKWYERQLIESHIYLVTCFLCMILVAACMEEFSFRAPGLRPFIMFGWMMAGLAIGLFSWRRYIAVMALAQHYVDHSSCTACGTYARFDIVDWGDPAPAALATERQAPGAGTWLKVCCRKCGHRWTME